MKNRREREDRRMKDGRGSWRRNIGDIERQRRR